MDCQSKGQKTSSEISFYIDNLQKNKNPRSYSLTLTLCRTTWGLLIGKRPSIFYELPTLPPDLVHHSSSKVQSTQTPSGNYSLCPIMGQSLTSCIMFARPTTHCSDTRYKVQFWVEWQSKYSSSGQSLWNSRGVLSSTNYHSSFCVSQWIHCSLAA